MAEKKYASGNSGRFLDLVSLLFIAIGIGMAVWTHWNIWDSVRMKSWLQTPATILEAKLESHSSDGSTTHETKAEYAYTFNGRDYQCRRVDIGSGADNVGSYQQDIFQILQRHKTSGKKFRCFVNPNDPTEAVLFPDLRWEMLVFKTAFAAVFGSMGLGGFMFGHNLWRKNKFDKSLKALHADEPWLWREDWAEGLITASNKSAMLAVILAAYWNSITALPAVLAIQEGYFVQKNNWALLASLFLVVGFILIIIAATAAVRIRKYGASVFQMASTPGVIGGQLAGVIRVPKKVSPDGGFHVTLRCVKEVTTDKGSSSETTWIDAWKAEQTIVRELHQTDPQKTAFPIQFAIPFDCQPTDMSGGSKIAWRLDVKAATPGLDFKASFDVPVFKTPESDPNFSPDLSAIDGYAAKVADQFSEIDPVESLRKIGVLREISPTSEGVRFVFPMMRQPSTAIAFTLIAIIFCAISFFAYYSLHKGWLEFFLIIPFCGLFALLGAIMLYASMDILFYHSMVDANPHGMTFVGGWFGFGRTHRIAASDIASLVPISRMSFTPKQSGNKKEYFDLDLHLKSGKRMTLGKHILGRSSADFVIRQIEAAMGK